MKIETDNWKVVTPVDLRPNRAEAVIRKAIAFAGALEADLTLLAVVPPRRFQRGHRLLWPLAAFDDEGVLPALHRVVMPGLMEEAVASYADRIHADIVLVGKEDLRRRWFLRKSVAATIAEKGTQAVLIASDEDGFKLRKPRIACFGERDVDAVRQSAEALVSKCGGEWVNLPADVPSSRLPQLAEAQRADLILAPSTNAELVSVAGRFPCPLLLLKHAVRSLATSCPR